MTQLFHRGGVAANRAASRSRVRCALGVLAIAVGLLGGCAGLLPKPAAQPTLLALDDAVLLSPPLAGAARAGTVSSTLIVEVPRAAPGYDTRNIAYLRRAHELEYFAVHQWADTPARMLAPLIVRALQRSQTFRAVAMAPTSASGELRLETELVRLQQDFTQQPSRVRLTLRALLIDSATRRVLAAREFDLSSVATSDDPYAGATAANQAVQQLLAQLVAFCAETAPR